MHLSQPYLLYIKNEFNSPRYINIFMTRNPFSLDKVVPMPSLAEVSEHTALPSPVIPSDHLALVADLSFSRPTLLIRLWNKLKATAIYFIAIFFKG